MMRMKSERRGLIFSVVIGTLLAATITTTPAQAVITHGHQVLLDKGLQLSAMAVPYWMTAYGHTFDVDLFHNAGFNTINICDSQSSWRYDDFVSNGVLPGAMNFTRYVPSWYAEHPSYTYVCSSTYTPNIIRLQHLDECSIVNTTSYPDNLSQLANVVSVMKAKYPTAMVGTNQSSLFHKDPSGRDVALTTAMIENYVQAVQPDILHFTEYPFRWQGTGYHDYYGGSPTGMYKYIEMYRKAGLAGLDGTGAKPIPVGMYVQTFAHINSAYTNGRNPRESEFRLQQFAGWAAGMKEIDAYIYTNRGDSDSMFFEGQDLYGQTPATEYYQYKELNRQSANLGPALVRLISTDFRMKMGRHGTGAGVTNTLPSGVSAFNATADPYLTGITATNLGTCNNGQPGDVVYGAYKPLDPSLVEEGCEDDVYFMIVNGLTDGVATTAAECAQLIQLTFDFGTSGINSLLRLSRDTGQVEEVALTQVNDSSVYTLDLTLDGGTGDLFKYNTGSAFIGTSSVPEPSVAVMAITALLGLIICVRQKRK